MNKNIRDKLIREVLDHDVDINKQLTSIQVKNAPKDEPIQPYVQISNVEIQRFNLFVASLRQVLEQKVNVARSKLGARGIVILCSIEEANQVIRSKRYYQ